jgi:hypothetical protein
VLTEEEVIQIETQLEVVEEVIVGTDEEGNDITAPVENIEVIGEVLVPSDEQGESNAEVFGSELSVDAELGTAIASVEGDETVILTTVTNLEIGEVVPQVEGETAEEVVVEEEKSISLDFDEAGNIILILRELKIGDLTVNVKLRALTDTLETYQVEEVTVDPEDVFDASSDESATEEVVEEPASELEVVEEPASEPEVVEEPASEPEVVEELTQPVPEPDGDGATEQEVVEEAPEEV